MLIVYSVGSKLSWRWTAIFACVPLNLLVLLMVFMPETPRWLLADNLRQKAITWLRGSDYDAEEECSEI